jgi:chorismate mutase
MLVRGIRGAITVKENTKKDILADTKELLLILKKSNDFNIEDIVSIFFSTTLDLDSAFPAAAARELGWSGVPLFGMQEANVQIGLKKCIRILIQINCEKKQSEIKHCYLREAKNLRKDL